MKHKKWQIHFLSINVVRLFFTRFICPSDDSIFSVPLSLGEIISGGAGEAHFFFLKGHSQAFLYKPQKIIISNRVNVLFGYSSSKWRMNKV